MEIKDIGRVIATIPSDYENLLDITCTETWIRGNNRKTTRIDINGTVKDAVITTCQNVPRCIALTRDEELIFSDSDSRAVNVVRHGKSETLIITPWDWLPWGLHCTRSGDIPVHIVMLYTVQNC